MALEFLAQLVEKVDAALKSVGADAPGNFKIYMSGSRTNVFIKADKLPLQPAITISVDLPGESDAFTVQSLNYALQAGRGNATPSNG